MNTRRFELVSGVVFCLIGIAQTMRVLFGLPILVGEVTVPFWPSMVAVIVLFFMAGWAFWLAAKEG